MEPVLFGTIGTSIVFSKLEPSTISKSVCIVLAGEQPAALTCTNVTNC
jgi:hypothetical protein